MTVTITDQMLEEAEARVVEADRELTRVRDGLDSGRVGLPWLLDEARASARAAVERLEELRAQHAAQGEARAERDHAAQAAAAALAPVVAQLDAARDLAAGAVADVRRALDAALDAIGTYSVRLAGAHATLVAHGLRAEPGDATGAELSGGARIDGTPWKPVDGPALLAQLVAEAIGRAHPHHHLGRRPNLADPGALALLERAETLTPA